MEGPTLESEAGSLSSTSEISSFFPKVEKKPQVFQDVHLRQCFVLVSYFTPLLMKVAPVKMP